MRTTWLTALTVTATLALTACGGDDPDCAAPAGSTPSGVTLSPGTLLACVDPSPDANRHNKADEAYVYAAMSHYSALIALADMVEQQSDHPEIADLAEEIRDELEDPLEQMDDLEDEWDLPLIVYDQAASTVLPAMEPDPVWEELRTLEGEEFDALWSQLTLETLESALASAETVLEEGRNAGLAETAEHVAELVEAWIAELESIADGLPG